MATEEYRIREILTAEECLTVLFHLAAVQQWLKSEAWDAALVLASKSIVAGRVSHEELTTDIGCLVMWKKIQDENPSDDEKVKDMYERTEKIIGKLQKAWDEHGGAEANGT